jgi:hypothetical protein
MIADLIARTHLMHRPGGPRGENLPRAHPPNEAEIRAAANSGKGPKGLARTRAAAATIASQCGYHRLAQELRFVGEAASRGER